MKLFKTSNMQIITEIQLAFGRLLRIESKLFVQNISHAITNYNKAFSAAFIASDFLSVIVRYQLVYTRIYHKLLLVKVCNS